ncbi:hypothetical protein [Desulforhopalus sp. IMCC35007]|uniref:hypothetical protein n=1 Tax=Desulforhopalus sp. IMCC35007 TaxID=2569543 RepID=UPI0010AE46CE|nr:hypothetical protein [Desulforhopalus sp. IMCC35007]TKB06382.1 hypothetical protein FCL48_21190 [Desulforhopalus sp. IMCC35007]
MTRKLQLIKVQEMTASFGTDVIQTAGGFFLARNCLYQGFVADNFHGPGLQVLDFSHPFFRRG